MTLGFRLRQAFIWGAILIATNAALLRFRADLDKAHVALILLLVVLGAGAAGGRALGLTIAGASFLLFDWFFLLPYNTFIITNPLDWMVLIAFLVTSIVAAQLLYREQDAAREARERAEEIDRLAALGAEALNAPRAEDALGAVVSVIRASTQTDACAVYIIEAGALRLGAVSPPDGAPAQLPPLVDWVAREGVAAAELEDGRSRLGSPGQAGRALTHPEEPPAHALLLPLMVRRQSVGALRIVGERLVALDDRDWRFLDALTFYAALGAERVRLASEAEHAGALREADRLKNALIASVSHDLRTPLTTIKALAHDLGALGDERSQVIEEQADRLNRFVGDLLDLSRLSAGAMPLRLEVNAIDDLFTAVVQEVEAQPEGRRLEAQLPSGDTLLVGRFDLAQSVRVLVNLVENAFKYSPKGSPVTLAARRDGDRLLVAVSDRGSGIPAAEQERIFTPFYRPPGAPPDAGSAGLGLAIARRMAEAQGGAVRYASRDGGGSIFTLVLPSADIAADRSAVADLTKS